jgi:hypothetical protein
VRLQTFQINLLVLAFLASETPPLPDLQMGSAFPNALLCGQVSYHGGKSDGPRWLGYSHFSALQPLFGWRLFQTLYLVKPFNWLQRNPTTQSNFGIHSDVPPCKAEVSWGGGKGLVGGAS